MALYRFTATLDARDGPERTKARLFDAGGGLVPDASNIAFSVLFAPHFWRVLGSGVCLLNKDFCLFTQRCAHLIVATSSPATEPAASERVHDVMLGLEDGAMPRRRAVEATLRPPSDVSPSRPRH